MSRRPHHGRNHHVSRGRRGDARPAVERPPQAAPPASADLQAPAAERPAPPLERPPEPVDRPVEAVEVVPTPAPVAHPEPVSHPEPAAVERHPPAMPNPAQASGNGASPDQPDANAGCTAPQLRRFIKSRAYVPMHELRRRFGINGGEDDVTGVQLEGTWVYVGLPDREGRLLGELFRGGEVGYELSLDPRTPVVVGVYPMRPVPRH
jgi:hypothetical protein